MNKIIESFLKYSNSNDILLDVYGINSNTKFNCVFVAPSWRIEKIFNEHDDYKITKLYEDRFSISHIIEHDGRKYLYVSLQVGAPDIVDFCLSCYKLNCDKFVFLGSAGAMVENINLGDIIIPEQSISGNGATLYLNDTLDKNNWFNKQQSNLELSEELKEICKSLYLKTKTELVVSVDSVMAEYAHLAELKQMGATIVEMETATFFKAMNLINKKAAAILVVSDNSAVGEHLIGRSDEQFATYRSSRKHVCKIITNIK